MKGLVGLLCLLSSLHAGLCITCYSCNNDPNSSGPYDTNCDTDGYDGNVINNNVHQTCYTNIYDDGSLYRGVEYDQHDDGTCSRYGSYTICFCASDKCNNNLCAHCGGNPTTTVPITTSEQTTDAPVTTPILTTEEPITTPEISTDAPSTTNQFTTIEPTDPPTTDPPTTDVPPTDPPTTDPPTTDSPTTIPPITDPPTTDLPTTDSPTTNPPITDPPTTDPPTTNPPTTDSPITNPPTTDLPITPEQTSPQSTTDEVITTEIETTTTTTTPPVISLACYDCQNSEPAYDNYDEDCGADDYAGMTYTCNNCFSCTVQVHDDGLIFRGEAGQFEDGECAFGEDVDVGGNYKTCYCTSDLCNTNLCQHCVPPKKY